MRERSEKLCRNGNGDVKTSGRKPTGIRRCSQSSSHIALNGPKIGISYKHIVKDRIPTGADVLGRLVSERTSLVPGPESIYGTSLHSPK